MMTYEKTHPWITFSCDTGSIDYRTWLKVGEAVSKMEQIAGVPLAPENAKQLHSVYLAKGVMATTAIEGNTLTEEEVLAQIEGRLELPPSRQYLGQEIENVVKACNLIGQEVIPRGHSPISPDDVKEYNRLVLEAIPLGEDVVPGEIRGHSVGVGRYRGAPAEDCEYLLARFCQWLNNLEFPEGLEQPFSTLTAIAAHLYFLCIHPFADGNGRTARLIEFRYLLQAGFPTPAAHLLSNFYNQTRTEYYRQLDKSSRKQGSLSSFIEYAVQGLVDQLKDQLVYIRHMQWETTWVNYVYERFGKVSPALHRRRRLVLALSKVNGEEAGWVRTSAITGLTPKLAVEYAGKTKKTLSRDLNELEKMNLIERSGRRVRANKKLILAFLPHRAKSDKIN